MRNEQEEFITKDVYLTASLLATGCTLEKLERHDKQITFHVKCDEDIQVHIDKYWAGELLLDAKTLFNSWRELRSRMYN